MNSESTYFTKMNLSFLKLHIGIFDKKKQLHWILFVDFDSQMKINFENKIDKKKPLNFGKSIQDL